MERKLTRVDTKRLPLRSSGNLLRGARVVQGLLTQAPTCLILPTLMTTSSTGTR